MKNIDFYSFEQQDEFIINIFDQKQNGFFLDVGCSHPVLGSNTYALEKQFGWNGYCFDMDMLDGTYWNATTQLYETVSWHSDRTAPWIYMDVKSPEFTEFLKINVKDTIVDYISLDVDKPSTMPHQPNEIFSLAALYRILDSNIKFKSITFEHEYRTWGTTYKNPAIEALRDNGFFPIVDNMKIWGGHVVPDSIGYTEDWWVHKDYFKDLINVRYSNIWYFDAVLNVRRIKDSKYIGHRHCSMAYPKQHDVFADDLSAKGCIDRDPWWRAAYYSDLT
jgi:hypothetical protein